MRKMVSSWRVVLSKLGFRLVLRKKKWRRPDTRAVGEQLEERRVMSADGIPMGIVSSLRPNIEVTDQAQESTFEGGYEPNVALDGFARDSFSPGRRFQPHIGASDQNLADPDNSITNVFADGRTYAIDDHWTWVIDVEYPTPDTWSYYELFVYTYTGSASWTDADGTSNLSEISGEYRYHFTANGLNSLDYSIYHLLETRDTFAELDWAYSRTFTNSYGTGTEYRNGDEEQEDNFRLSVTGTRTVSPTDSVTKDERYDYDLDGYVDSLIWTSITTPIWGGTESKATTDDSYLLWEYDAEIVRIDVDGVKTYDEDFLYELDIDLYDTDSESTFYTRSTTINGVTENKFLDTSTTDLAFVETDFLLDGERHIDEFLVVDGKSRADYRYERTDNITIPRNEWVQTIDKAIPGLVATSKTTGSAPVVNKATLVRSSVGNRRFGDKHDDFKVAFGTTYELDSAWSTVSVNNTKVSDKSVAGSASSLTAHYVTYSSGVSGQNQLTNGTQTRVGTVVTTTGSSSLNFDSLGSGVHVGYSKSDAVHSSSSPGAYTYAITNKKQYDNSTTAWNTKGWSTGTLLSDGTWAVDKGENYFTSATGTTKYDSKSHGKSKTVSFPAIGVTETITKDGYDTSKGQTFYTSVAHGSQSKILGIFVSNDFSQLDRWSKDHSTSSATADLVHVDTRTSGKVTNATSHSTFSSVTDSKSKAKHLITKSNFDGNKHSWDFYDDKTDGITVSNSTTNGHSVSSEIENYFYRISDTTNNSKRSETVNWNNVEKHDWKYDSLIGKRGYESNVLDSTGTYTLSGSLYEEIKVKDQKTPGLVRTSKSKTLTSWQGNGTSTGLEQEKMKVAPGLATVIEKSNEYTATDSGTNQSDSKTTSKINGTQVLRPGVTQETHSVSIFIDNRLGKFVSNISDSKSNVTVGTETTKTARSFYENNEKGTRDWFRNDQSKVTNTDRSLPNLKTWDETKLTGLSEFDGVYVLHTVAETNLYADGTTDTSLLYESTDNGLTQSYSDVKVASKSTDARHATGFNIDAEPGTTQIFTGTVLHQTGSNHTTSKSSGTLWTYGVKSSKSNSLGMSNSIGRFDSKSNDWGSSVYIYESKADSKTRTPSTHGFSWSTAKEVKKLEGKDTSVSSSITQEQTMNGLHTASKASTDAGTGKSREKVTTIRHQDSSESSTIGDWTNSDVSVAHSKSVREGMGLYNFQTDSTYQLFVDGTTELYSKSNRAEYGNYDDKTKEYGLGTQIRKTVATKDGSTSTPKFQEKITYRVDSTKDYTDVDYVKLSSSHFESYRNGNSYSSKKDSYQEEGDVVDKSKRKSTLAVSDYGHTKSYIHVTQNAETESILNLAGTFEASVFESVVLVSGVAPHTVSKNKFDQTSVVTLSKNTSKSKVVSDDYKYSDSKGMATHTVTKSNNTSTGTGTSSAHYLATTVNSVTTEDRNDELKVNGTYSWSNDSKSVTTRNDIVDDFADHPVRRINEYDWKITTTNKDNGGGNFETTSHLQFNRYADGSTKSDKFELRKEIFGAALSKSHIDGSYKQTSRHLMSGKEIRSKTSVDNKGVVVTSWSGETSTHTVKLGNNIVSLVSTDKRNEISTTSWNDSTKSNSSGDAETLGHAIITSTGHNNTTSEGLINATQDHAWTVTYISDSPNGNGGTPEGGNKEGYKYTTANGGGKGTWDKYQKSKTSRSVNSITYDISEIIEDKGKSKFSVAITRKHDLIGGISTYNTKVGTQSYESKGTKTETEKRSLSGTSYSSGNIAGGTFTKTVTSDKSTTVGTITEYGSEVTLAVSHKSNGDLKTDITVDKEFSDSGTTRIEDDKTTTYRVDSYSTDNRVVDSKKVETHNSVKVRTDGWKKDGASKSTTTTFTETTTTQTVSDINTSDKYGSDKDHDDNKSVHTVTHYRIVDKNGGEKYESSVSHKVYVDNKHKGEYNRKDNIYEKSYGGSGDFHKWIETDNSKTFDTRTEKLKVGESKVEVTLQRVVKRTYQRNDDYGDSGSIAGGGYGGYGGWGSYGGTWSNSSTHGHTIEVDHEHTAVGHYDPNSSGYGGYGGFGGGSGWNFNQGYGGGDPTDGIFNGQTNAHVTITSFTGHTKQHSSISDTYSWNNTGIFAYYEGGKPAGGNFSIFGHKLDGTYSLIPNTNQVTFSGTNGGYGASTGSPGYDKTNQPFSVKLQIATGKFIPELESSWQFSTGGALVNSARDLADWIEDVETAFAIELYLAVSDPGGAWGYYEPLIIDAYESYQSWVNGKIDGFLDVMNPFEGLTVFGYELSIPNLGPIEGHEFEYAVGYVVGAASGLAVQIGIGILSGGASASACASALVKVGLAAARVYTFLDTVGAIGNGIKIAHNLATNGDKMTGWEITGNVAMIGLSFAPALGAAGGAALKKLNGPEFLRLGGCFVAGTPVHLSSQPESTSERDLLFASFGKDGFDQGAQVQVVNTRTAPMSTVPIEQVPLAARVDSKNPREWEVQPTIAIAGEDWYEVHATILRSDGNRVEIELLRPESWVRDAGIELGSELELHLPELKVSGLALVTKLDRRVDLETSDVELGNLVTGRFKTLGATNVVRATFSDGTVIDGTDNHPFWSVDREDWIPLGELEQFERVQARTGTVYLTSLQNTTSADVFNIEVDCQHVYDVGDSGILVHNACDTNMMGRIGERLAIDLLQKRGWTVLGGLSRGRNGIDLIAQKFINGKLQTLLIEVKVNSSRLSKLQKLGPRGYADDVLKRFNDSSLTNYNVVQELVKSKNEIRGLVIRFDWRSGELIEKISRWRKK